MAKSIAVLLLLSLASPLLAGASGPGSPNKSRAVVSSRALKTGAQVNPSRFPDVPAEHWAAGAVTEMSKLGVMKGYPNAKFQGEKPVTRYELAVALQRFAQFIEASRDPLAPAPETKSQSGESVEPRAGTHAHQQSGTAPSKASVSAAPRWAKSSSDYLTSGGFIPKDSPLLKDGNKPVDSELLAQSLASVAFRLAVLDADRQASGTGEQQARQGVADTDKR